MKNKLFVLLTMVVMFIPSVALADTATVNQAPKISQGQGLSETPSEKAKSNADDAADKVSKSAIESKKYIENESANNSGKVAQNISEQIVGGAKDAAGNPTDSTGLDIMGVFGKLDQLTDSIGGNVIGLLVKFFYYTSFVGFLFCAIAAIISLFKTKSKPMKWILSAAGCGLVFYGITAFLGVNIFSNPLTELFGWLFTT